MSNPMDALRDTFILIKILLFLYCIGDVTIVTIFTIATTVVTSLTCIVFITSSIYFIAVCQCSTLFYAAETWTVTPHMKIRLDTF